MKSKTAHLPAYSDATRENAANPEKGSNFIVTTDILNLVVYKKHRTDAKPAFMTLQMNIPRGCPVWIA